MGILASKWTSGCEKSSYCVDFKDAHVLKDLLNTVSRSLTRHTTLTCARYSNWYTPNLCGWQDNDVYLNFSNYKTQQQVNLENDVASGKAHKKNTNFAYVLSTIMAAKK